MTTRDLVKVLRGRFRVSRFGYGPRAVGAIRTHSAANSPKPPTSDERSALQVDLSSRYRLEILRLQRRIVVRCSQRDPMETVDEDP